MRTTAWRRTGPSAKLRSRLVHQQAASTRTNNLNPFPFLLLETDGRAEAPEEGDGVDHQVRHGERSGQVSYPTSDPVLNVNVLVVSCCRKQTEERMRKMECDKLRQGPLFAPVC